jgi:SAM-dependent methyltransferase
MRFFKKNMVILDLLNEVILPLKLIVPQPVIAKLPGLTTNEEIRNCNVLRCFSRHQRSLDIGCGNNRLMKMHRERGGDGVGVDVHDWGDVDLLVEDCSKLDFDDRSFDCITFVASLNHIPNREQVLKEAHRILNDHGIVIVTMLNPFLSIIWHKWAFWDRDQHERGMKPGEVYGFSDEEMRELFSTSGFNIIRKRTFSWGLNTLFIAEKAVGE